MQFLVRDARRPIGFLNVAWDGDAPAFLLDVTVHPEFQRRGIGTERLRQAARAAGERGCEWLHVDFEPALEPFYRSAGYGPTAAGLLYLPQNRWLGRGVGEL
jgi:GNAT superfamily N-acetyltransferase